MTAPARWVAAKLIADGQMTRDHITHTAQPRRCTCGLYVLVGLDDLLPSVVRVDPTPTTSGGEAFALLTGRRSYGLDRGQLYGRTASRIQFRPADGEPVFVSHVCDQLLPANTKYTPSHYRPPLDGPPPF